MTTQPEPFRYTDPTDPFGHTLTVVHVDASTYNGTIPVVSLGIQVPKDATDPENPLVYIPLADTEQVVAAIRTAAGQPADRAALHERIADAIRDAACPGDCDKTEAECTKERIQPFVWHHGRLTVVEGEPEMFADAVLAVLPEPATDRPGKDNGLSELLAAAKALQLDRDAASSGESSDYRRGMTRAVKVLRLLAESEQADEAQQPTAGTGSLGKVCTGTLGPKPPQSQPDARRERYAAAMRGAVCDDPDLMTGGEEQVISDLADAVMAVADEEQQEMANAAVRFTAAIRQQNARLRAELEQARATVLRERADFYEGVLRDSLDLEHDPRYCTAIRDIVLGLRRLAAETAAGFGGQAEDGAPATVRLSYRLEHRNPGDTAWQPNTPGIGANWSWQSREKADQQLTTARDRWPDYEHRLIAITTTVTETVVNEGGAQQQ
ncbi:hypothetical protein [Streptomyces sp. 35G-GA-8]|uniref:hypothetical protein n=1 Tax=Streptomyces sp. 35G-GA-8 TaxID=2939434 RepID=UPI00201E7A2C|nr:hypothetical protein [Streptomyces sp. 35G-GA-8]MCL7377441.1 hypothetical protein [Streptomyces sp. 35G-GA-8]